MKSLEDILRAKAKSGALNHLSIAYRNGGGWQVAYRGVDHADHRLSEGADVVDVIMDALTGRKSAPTAQTIPAVAKPTKPKRAAPKPKAASLNDDILGDLM